MIYFVLGGARSGKSKYAADLAQSLSDKNKKTVLNVATAQVFDDEMKERIAKHQADRPQDWLLAEIPLTLSEFIAEQAKQSQQHIILIDCLTLWLNNQLFADPSQDFAALITQLQTQLLSLSCDVILVANEVGLGVIPMGKVSRQFVDEAGRLNQKMAQIAHEAVFMAAGLPLKLKGSHNDNEY